MTRVSVVTPSFRAARFLERTIASVAAQQYPDLEYIVVDGGSDDGTGEILERWSQHVDLAIVEPDDGQADALIKGFTRASGEVLAWLNADDCYAHPGAISTLMSWLGERPDVGVIAGRRVHIDADGLFVASWPYRPFDADVLRHTCYLPQECCLFRRSAYEEVGGLDHSFSFALDYDLWLRMLDADVQFLAVPDIVGLFRWHEDQKSQMIRDEVGLPEIARIHQRVLGRVPDLDEMEARLQTYWFGPDARASKRVGSLQVNEMISYFRAQLFDGIALDQWPEVGRSALATP